MSDQLEEAVRKYALQNAVFFKGKANPKAVVGKVLGEMAEYRSRSAEVAEVAARVVAEVNAMGPEEQSRALQAIDPSMLVRERKERTYELPDLEGVDGKVVMRIAPGPSGPLHIGHTRVSILNDEYVKRYGGELVLRYEDTNPEKVDPEAYDMIAEDLDWLGVKVHRTYIQSDRFELYYDCARRLLEMGKAYVCTCEADHWRELKDHGQACPCRELPVEEQLERYDKFLNRGYREGQAVVVVKTDLNHPNPAIRDFVGLRLVDHPHPRTGDRYQAYPMMNLAVAVDDHEMGMTHVVRGKDHLNNTLRQEYVFDYFGWRKPVYHHYGLVHIEDTMLKTSVIGSGIRSGEYTGWDDVRLGTVRALERRGIKAQAIRNYWVEAGIKSVDVQFSWDGLFGKNREIIDPVSDRYFFVEDPVRYDIDGVDEIQGSAPKHPDHPERGSREYLLKAPRTVYLSAEDSKMFYETGHVRLKDLCNIDFGLPAKYAGNDVSVLRHGVKAVQWVGADGVDAELLMPDGTVRRGLAERSIMDEESDTVQLERVGFARIESRADGRVSMVFTHR